MESEEDKEPKVVKYTFAGYSIVVEEYPDNKWRVRVRKGQRLVLDTKMGNEGSAYDVAEHAISQDGLIYGR